MTLTLSAAHPPATISFTAASMHLSACSWISLASWSCQLDDLAVSQRTRC
jgi:hypothetical protein